MNLFGIKARRATARPALTRPYGWSNTGRVGAPMMAAAQARYDDRVRAAVVDNPVAQRACRLVAEAVGSAPIASADPLVPALLVERSTGQSLLETCAMHMMLHGNVFIQIISADGGHGAAGGDDGARPAELYALRPDRVAVEVDAHGWPVAYSYRAGAETVRLPAEDALGRPLVVHVKQMHPLDDHYGLGCLSAASGAVAIHNAAAQWNKALLDNAARPSGALVYDVGEAGAALTGEQFARLRDEMEAQFQGSANAGRPMLLDGGLKWQSISLSPAEMDFIRLKDSAARDIAMAFGVPPMLMGLPGDATYANYREASKSLWRQTVLPMADTVLKGISQALRQWGMPDGASVDLNQVLALADDRERLWSQVSEAAFLSNAEKRAMLGIVDSADGPEDGA
ncbi:MAG: phage portal protein [Sphingopyxis sp.]